jgi:hypothetical protein
MRPAHRGARVRGPGAGDRVPMTMTIPECQDSTTPTDHEWVVFSTCSNPVAIMVECSRCGAHGLVGDSTQEEWNRTPEAEESPYLWEDGWRVGISNLTPSMRYITTEEGG